jgi:hypothetical protein
MTGAELKTIRQNLELRRSEFALLLGYVGNDRNNNLRVRRLEEEELVPLYIGRLVWLIDRWCREHNGNLPHWPEALKIEGETKPWT